MGIELVKLLFARDAAGLSARALVVLGYMSVDALDKPNEKGRPARLYFAGWEPLALALGYDRLTRAAQEKVRRALKELREAGLIEPMEAHAQTGTRQSYRVLVGLSAAQDCPTNPEGQSVRESPTDSEGQSPTDSEGQEPHRSGVKSPTDSEGPRKEQESREDSFQESMHPRRASTSPPRAREASEVHAFVNDGFEFCTDCGEGRLHASHISHRRAATREAS